MNKASKKFPVSDDVEIPNGDVTYTRYGTFNLKKKIKNIASHSYHSHWAAVAFL